MKLLIKGIHLHLIHRWHNTVKRHQIGKPVRMEIADADRTDFSRLL